MEKTEAVSKLKKAGYQVQFDSSVVTVLLPQKTNMNSEIKKIRSFLREAGYDASFGVRQLKAFVAEEEIPEEMEEDKETEENKGIETEEEMMQAEEITDIQQFSLEDFGIS